MVNRVPWLFEGLTLLLFIYQEHMSITEFIEQAHPSTLDWIENEWMEQLVRMDNIRKMVDQLAEINKLSEVK